MTHDLKKSFISYSHRDERFREQLQEHLHALERRGLIEVWQDRSIAPDEVWEGAISENLETAGIVLLLVSSSFIASPHCCNTEMVRALERHESGEARVIPVIFVPRTGATRLSPVCKPSRRTADPSGPNRAIATSRRRFCGRPWIGAPRRLLGNTSTSN